jgi:osmotically-inducible protein OsmY
MRSASSEVAVRTDPEILAEAWSALDHDVAVPGTVHVHVARGVARLTGTVRLPSERMAAERAIQNIDGLRRIVNTIVVTQRVSAEGFEAPDIV